MQPPPPCATILMPIIGGIMVDDAGRYIVQQRIGHHPDTAPVQVYTVQDQETQQIVVAKVLTLADDREDFMENILARFLRETQIMRALHHPSIVPVLDFAHTSRRFWLILPYYAEGTLMRQMERRHGVPYPISDACALIVQMCAALHEGHRQQPPIIHRDVKPQNMFLLPHPPGTPWLPGAILLADYGIAHLLGEVHLTRAEMAVGTPECMAPEQILPRHGDEPDRVDARADVYALGCCLYWLLSGFPPFAGATPVALARAHLYLVPKPLNQLNHRVNHGLTLIVARALAKAPDDRYQSMLAFAKALRPFCP